MITPLYLLFFGIHLSQAIGRRETNFEFNQLWDDVRSKLDSDSSGIGPFTNAEEEFGPAKRSERFQNYKDSMILQRSISLETTAYTTELNYFSLMTEDERKQYLSKPSNYTWQIPDTSSNILDLAAGLDDSSTSVVDATDGTMALLKADVRTRHSGTSGTGGLMAALTLLDYVTGSTFSSLYWTKCMNPTDEDGYKFPSKIWSFLQDDPYIPLEDDSLKMGKGKDLCSGDLPNGFPEDKEITEVEEADITNEKLLLQLEVQEDAWAPVTICLQVKDPSFYFYSSGLYSHLPGMELTAGATGGICNHFVVLVGYTEDYLVIHNSWGTDWGIEGRMKIKRSSSSNLDALDFFVFSFPTILPKTTEDTPKIRKRCFGFNGLCTAAFIGISGTLREYFG